MTILDRVCDIIQTQMALADGQVYIYNQKFNIPKDQALYVAIGILKCKPFSNTRAMVSIEGGGFNEIISVNMQAILSVDILSRGTDARDRKEEILLALGSTYSQQVQEANGFQIAKLSSDFVNLSEMDGSSIPSRFNISVAVQYSISKTQGVPYFDTFTDAAITNT